MARVRAGDVTAVICWHPDRLHRRPVELEAYIDASKAGGVVTYSVKAGEMDLATDAGQLVARMLGAAARYESDTKATRIRRSSEQAIRAGKWTGGTRPFGWLLDEGEPRLHPEEAPALADAFSRVVSGDSLGSIVRSLNEADITTTHGKPWGYAQLRQALLRPRNAGLADLHGEIVGKSTFPAIVSENVWTAVASILSDPTRRRSQSNKARHLLAGIAQCHCGALVRSATVTGRDGTKHRIYRCPERGPGHVSKRIEFVDAVFNAVIVAVRGAEKKSPAGEEVLSDERRRLQVEIDALRRRRDDATIEAAEGRIPMGALGLVLERIEVQASELSQQMVALEARATRVLPQDIPSVAADSPLHAEWLAMNIDDRRDYVRSVCNVLLLPHGRGSTKVFNPDTVQVLVKGPGEGPGPLDQRTIAQRLRAETQLQGHGGGQFISFPFGDDVVTYRLNDDWLLASDHERENTILSSLVPLEERGERLLQQVRADERSKERGLPPS